MMASPLVSAAELAVALPRGDVLVLDCRFDLADFGKSRRAHRDAHVPGAVYVDLDEDLSDLSRRGLGRHPLPDDARWSAALSRAGWRAGRHVVVYDDANGALAAARAWWLLRLVGEANMQVLDGGWSAWRAAGLPVESGDVTPTPSDAVVHIDGNVVVGYDELQRRLAANSVLLIDARAAPRFRGEVEPIDRVGGHVPGAVNRPFADNLAADGRFKPADVLRAEFSALLGTRAPTDVAHMCGSGVTACHNLLAMEYAGLHGSRVFAPSWSGWIDDPSRPIAKGP